MKKILSWCKRSLITSFGMKDSFRVSWLNKTLIVDYNLRNVRPERDFSIILQLAQGKKCFLDVGANHGAISFLVCINNADIQVHAFEASEEAVSVINNNVGLNNLEKFVRVINALVADSSGCVIPFYGEGGSGGASITQGRLGHQTEVFKTTLALDDYVTQFNIAPDFIKVDIEGAEGIAIRGMANILRNNKPFIFVELHEVGEKKLYENASDILDFISDYGYVMVYLRGGVKVTNTEIMKDRGRCHVLLLHTDHYSESYIQSLDLNGL